MSIEQWSMVYFVFSALYYAVILLSLFTILNIKKILLTMLAFLVQCGVTFAYGISTDQIGLVLVAIMQVIVTTIMFIQYGRIFNENQDA